MWPVVVTVGWMCVFLSTACVDAQVKLYKKVGDDVVLQASPLPSTIISISWKESVNIAVQWEGNEIMYYRQFRERGSLNISSGELTITKLARGDSNLYTPEINNVIMAPTQLIVISPVPKPTISSSYNSDDVLVLTCNGGAMDSEPISYKWRSSGKELSNSSKELNITKEDPLHEFSCELINPVSQESSQPFPNPFLSTRGKVKISTGLIVFISLLAALIVLVLLHRWKAGTWFFQKASKPWEADFWKKPERRSRDAAESNGATAPAKTDPTDGNGHGLSAQVK